MDGQIAGLARRSRNFGYLAPHEPLLVLDGATAEAYVYADPDAAMFKARRFTETLATLLVSRTQTRVKSDKQVERVRVNMLLHGIGQPNGPSLIEVRDSLAEPPTKRPGVVLANPPFGKKSSITVIGEDGRANREDTAYSRNDFWVTTTNKQLNFVQHIASLLDVPGRAAVVVPDNVLFEGGAGETVRRRLLQQFDVHTLLRLPTGIFYAGGVKANVLFFDKLRARPDTPWTTRLWVYDLRTGQHFTLKQNRLQRHHLDDFVACYRPGEPRERREETERFRPFSYEELVARDKANLDITWLTDPSLDEGDTLLPPEVIAREIVEDLEAALSEFAAIAEALQQAKSAKPGDDQ